MSSTQPLTDEESLPLHYGDGNKYGYLVVDGNWHEITVGETKIGRDASVCSIVLGDATLSMLHAVIESEGPEDSFIYDANSSNKTKIGKMTLKPQCRYKINNNDTILMGNKIVQYKITDHRVQSCNTESSFNIFKSSKSDGESNFNIIDEKNKNAFDADRKLVLCVGEQAKTSDELQKSLSSQEKFSNRPNKPYYILASELFNADIFSQATQCEVRNEQNECFKDRNKELVNRDDDMRNMKAQCDYLRGINKDKSELKCYKESGEKIKKITESYLDDSVTFDFVRRNESKHTLSSVLCKSISDDIFDLPTQCQLKTNNSQEVLPENDQNFKNCFASKFFKSGKTEEGLVKAVKTELKNDLCKPKTNDPNSGDIDSEFFDDDKDEEFCELMRNISPGTNQNKDCMLQPRKNLTENNGLKESNIPDEIFEIQTQFDPDLSKIKNFNQSEIKTLDSEHNESEKCKISQANQEESGLTKTEQTLSNSIEACNLKTQKVKTRNTKNTSKKKLKKGFGETVNNGGVNINGNTSKFDLQVEKISNQETTENSGGDLPARIHPLNSDNSCGDSENTARKEHCIGGRSVLSDNSLSEVLNDESDSDSEIRLRCEDTNKKGGIIRSPLIAETLNELWEKRSNCSRASSNKTLSDLDIREFVGNGLSALESDTEENFIATQGSYLLNKSNSEASENKIESAVKKTKSKLDIWKENWQDFIFTQNVSDEKRKKSESESTDKTESDIVVSANPIPNIEHYEINETSSEDCVFNIEESSNESECLIKKNIEDETSSNGDAALAEEDLDQFKCESPVLLQSSIQTDNVRGEEGRNLIKTVEENVNKECEPTEIRVVSDSDETDCEEELKTRELSFIHKVPGFDNNEKGEEVFPSTSDLRPKEKKCRETEPIYKENIFVEKREDSPLKRTRKSEGDTVLPKKRSKNTRKEKEGDDVGVRQLRSRRARACKETFQSEDGAGKTNEVKGSSRKKVTNSSTASRKKLDFVIEKSIGEADGAGSSCSESKWEPSSVNVVFTGFESENHNRIISRLGGLRVNDFDEGNVLVTDKVRRTVKFLSAVALGLPIVSPKWLLSSNKELKFVNPWNFLLEDEASEERWGFNLKDSLENWKKDKLLKGFNVFATKSTKPPVPEILSIVKCCGGMAFSSHPEKWPEKSILLTCLEDKNSWPHYKYRSVKIVHYEFLLSGVLKHAMDFKTYKLR